MQDFDSSHPYSAELRIYIWYAIVVSKILKKRRCRIYTSAEIGAEFVTLNNYCTSDAQLANSPRIESCGACVPKKVGFHSEMQVFPAPATARIQIEGLGCNAIVDLMLEVFHVPSHQ